MSQLYNNSLACMSHYRYTNHIMVCLLSYVGFRYKYIPNILKCVYVCPLFFYNQSVVILFHFLCGLIHLIYNSMQRHEICSK